MKNDAIQTGLHRRLQQLFYGQLPTASQKGVNLARYELEPVEDVCRCLIDRDRAAAEEEQKLWAGYTKPAEFSAWYLTLLTNARAKLAGSDAVNSSKTCRREFDLWLDELETLIEDVLRFDSSSN